MIPKFRAFWLKEKIMTNIDAIYFLEDGIKVENGCCYSEFVEDENVVLMQSTGLHDKNGVEIFEGDIVEHFDFNSNEISKSEVRILKGCFYLVISVDGFKYDVPMMDLKDDECILEIKGNVHQHPELLDDV